jgi:hypothetical protein
MFQAGTGDIEDISAGSPSGLRFKANFNYVLFFIEIASILITALPSIQLLMISTPHAVVVLYLAISVAY